MTGDGLACGAECLRRDLLALGPPATCDGLIESNHTGFSGSGFCNGNNAAGAAAQFTLTASFVKEFS